jgi:hypothetical protein
MCQGDLGTSDVLTPFEDCITDELTRGNPDTAAAKAALRYARRAARLACALSDILDPCGTVDREMRDVMESAKRILDEESEAARRGE